MNWSVFYGILIPFLGTSFGAACVFFMKKEMGDRLQRMLTGFAAGVMVAASIWSLLIPAMEQVVDMGKLAFVPAVAGFWCGILFLLLLDHIIPHRGNPVLMWDESNWQALCKPCHDKKTWTEDKNPVYTY